MGRRGSRYFEFAVCESLRDIKWPYVGSVLLAVPRYGGLMRARLDVLLARHAIAAMMQARAQRGAEGLACGLCGIRCRMHARFGFDTDFGRRRIGQRHH